MDYKYITQLLERYWNCETSLEEEAILRTFFSQKDVPAELLPYKDLFTYEATEANEEEMDKLASVLRERVFKDNLPPAPPAPPAPPKPEADLVIYQLKGGEATRDIRFESYDSLAKQGMTPDIANYDLVYEGRMADVTDSTDLRMQLEAVFHKFNMDRSKL